jgi:hypothetical protein
MAIAQSQIWFASLATCHGSIEIHEPLATGFARLASKSVSTHVPAAPQRTQSASGSSFQLQAPHLRNRSFRARRRVRRPINFLVTLSWRTSGVVVDSSDRSAPELPASSQTGSASSGRSLPTLVSSCAWHDPILDSIRQDCPCRCPVLCDQVHDRYLAAMGMSEEMQSEEIA